MFWIFLSVVCVLAALAISVMRHTSEAGSPIRSKLAGHGRTVLVLAFLGFGALGLFNKVFSTLMRLISITCEQSRVKRKRLMEP